VLAITRPLQGFSYFISVVPCPDPPRIHLYLYLLCGLSQCPFGSLLNLLSISHHISTSITQYLGFGVDNSLAGIYHHCECHRTGLSRHTPTSCLILGLDHQPCSTQQTQILAVIHVCRSFQIQIINKILPSPWTRRARVVVSTVTRTSNKTTTSPT